MNQEKQRNLLIINSSKKSTGTDTDFTYELGDTSLNIDALSVKSVFVPHTFTNVNSINNVIKVSTGSEIVVVNNIGYWIVNGIGNTMGIPAKAYTLQELIAAINYQVGNVFTTSYNATTDRCEFTLKTNVEDGEITLDGTSTTSLWRYFGINTEFSIPNPAGSSVSGNIAPPVPNVINSDLTIPTGQYDIATLTQAVVTEISNAITGPLSHTILVNGRIRISGATQTWKFIDCFISKALGFTGEEAYTLLQTATNLPSLYGTKNIYIKSNLLCNGYNSIQADGEKDSILINIPINSVYGGQTNYEANYPIIKNYATPINISSIDIQIVDDDGIVIDTMGNDILIICETYSSRKL
jgi:hypothetical protein